MREIHFDRLTSPEVGEALQDGWDTVVFACGATEQHGPHLALSMDASHGTALALAVARRIGRALVAPTIRVGCSEHHMAFAGTLTLRPETFLSVVEDYVDSLARHGFRRVVIVPTHGGNFAPLSDGLERLRTVAGERARVEAFVDLAAVMEVWTAVAEAEAGRGAGVGGHADVAEGSILLALHPEAVRSDRVEPGRLGPLDAEVTRRLFAEGMAAISPNGILGDPTGMNAALGRRLVEALAARVVESLSVP
ncbi:MAG: creatininase family protein [Gemmatimonadetes bacterium]|nr:creatininase family protein [Gemmatimonadota bacterium]